MVTGPAADRPVRLVLLHHAGGSRLVFRGWDRALPADWEVLAVDAPGRGFHHDLPALDNFDAMVEFVCGLALAELDRPLAIFGHSMGGAVATGVANRLIARGGPVPVWLGVSGWGAERRTTAGAVERLRAETSDDLRARLTKMGGTPASLFADPVLWRMVEPLLREDLTVVADHDPTADRSWLRVPLSLFGGRSDAVVSERRLTELAAAAKTLIGLHLYAGNHFYLTDHVIHVTRQIIADVRAALWARPDPVHLTKGA
ncbi:MAG TPA: alpha/beta fold hydrolase [Actinokineospora sp.]|jgi:surfactin synthase thioesterase subunit|nr:alpha/beta fold hydrolase [Actinokineospora sp.]